MDRPAATEADQGERFGAGPMPVNDRAAPDRLLAVDLVRGAALFAMFVYHFAFDLALFGFVDWQVASDPLWRGFAVSIAGTFIMVAGVSLVLAHGDGIRWRAFARREAVLVAAAAAVTAATLVAIPDAPVLFGILHAIALFSLLGLPFLFLPAWASLAAAAAVLVLPFLFRSPAFDGSAFVWLGLAQTVPPMVDHEPLFPWFAATLAGIAIARLLDVRGLGPRWRQPPKMPPTRTLAFMGRNSLLVYLVHQPVFFAILMPLAWAFPPQSGVEASFRAECERVCTVRQGEAAPCASICACVVKDVAAAGLFAQMVGDAPPDPALERAVTAISEACAAGTPRP